MSQCPSPGAVSSRSARILTHAIPGAGARRGGPSAPSVRHRANHGVGPLLPAPSLDAATAGTIRRLTELLLGIDPITTQNLHGLRELCAQLHSSQSAIDTAASVEVEAAPVPAFRQAVLVFTRRLHAALLGREPALVIKTSDDVETLCLGLCAFASVRAPSPYPARRDLMAQASQALEGITGRMLAILNQRHGVDGMGYGQTLTVHNWISRACKARLLCAGSDCMQTARTFSEEAFAEFLRLASAWDADGRKSMRLNEHDLGKTAAELEAMLDYGLVQFDGQEDSLARVLAWLGSAQAFNVLLSAEHGVGLSSLFNLFKRVLDLSAQTMKASGRTASAQEASGDGTDVLAPLWKQMLASIGSLTVAQLMNRDGRCLAACANLVRAIHESALPRGWKAEQRLAFASTGRHLLETVAGADPVMLSGLSLQTLANLVSLCKAWHKHEMQGCEQPASGDVQTADAPGRPGNRDTLPPDILGRLKAAALRLAAALPPDRLARLDRMETAGGLLKGLSYLRSTRLLAASAVDPLLRGLAHAAATIADWPAEHAIGVVKCLKILWKCRVFEWDALQPAFFALMGPPADDESWSEGDVDAFLCGDFSHRQTLSIPLERHVKPAYPAQDKPLRVHVVGDRPAPAPVVLPTCMGADASLPAPPNRRLPSMPRYARRDGDGFVEPARVARTKSGSPNATAGRTPLATDREADEDVGQPRMKPGPADDPEFVRKKGTAKPDASKTASPPRKEGRRGRKKAGAMALPANDLAADMAQSLPQTALPAQWQKRQTVPPAERRAIARKLFAAIDKHDEQAALALLAGPGGQQLAGSVDEAGNSLLSAALRVNMLFLTRAVLEYPAGRMHAAKPDQFGVTPLYLAAGKADLAITETLLGIDDVVKGASHRTITDHDAVGAAIDEDNAAVLARLMQIKAVRDALPHRLYPDGSTVLQAAIRAGSSKALKVLLTHPELARQAAMPLVTRFQGTPRVSTDISLAKRAAHKGHLSLVTSLVEHPVVRAFEAAAESRFNLAGMALHSGNRQLLDYLLGFPELQQLAGLRTVSGMTPLMLAVHASDAELFARLLKVPAVRATVLSSPLPAVPMEYKWPADMQPPALGYGDVLELAAMQGKSDMVNALLEVQEALDAIDTRGDYAQKVLLLCIRCGMPEALETLLQRPFVRQVARIADSNGMNALHHAAQQGHRGVVGLLLRALPAGDIMRANRAGKHAVDLAKEGGHGEVFMLIAAAALVSGAGEKH